MNKFHIHLIIFALLPILFCCKEKQPKKIPLASVNSHFLYITDLSKVFPKGLSSADSSIWANNYIQTWIRSQLMIETAENNLSSDQKDVQEQLDNYRNSLLTFRYKQKIMEQKMDTIISDEEMMSYYLSHQKDFILNQDIVKAIYLKIQKELANKKKIKSLFFSQDSTQLTKLDEFGHQYAKLYDRFGDQWIPASEIFSQFPEKIKKQSEFLQRNKFIESSDPDYYYFICIRDFKMKGQNAPFSFVSSRIHAILRNKRKVEFLKNLENKIYQQGIATNKFKIYNIQK